MPSSMHLEVLKCTTLADILSIFIKCSREIPAKNCKVFCSIYRRFNEITLEITYIADKVITLLNIITYYHVIQYATVPLLSKQKTYYKQYITKKSD